MALVRSELRSFWLPVSLLYAVLAVAMYAPVLVGRFPVPAILVTQFAPWSGYADHDATQRVADIGDLIDYFYPVHLFSSAQIQQGRFPQWNPHVMMGIPLQAEPQSQLFYPPHFLYYVFSTPMAWTLMLMLRIWLAAMFMTALMRELGASKTGSVVAAIAFSLCGFSIAWQGTPMSDAMIWLPLVCYATLRLSRQRTGKRIAMTAVAFAMPVLAGHPETAIHITLVGCATALFLWIFPEEGRPRFDVRFMAAFGAAGVLAVGLTGIQLLPTMDWIYQVERSITDHWPSLDRHQILGFVSRDIGRAPNSASILVPNGVAYIGMFTLLAAAQALLSRPRRYVIWFGCLAVFGFAASFGMEPVQWLLRHTPVIQGLKNERLIFVSDFGLAVLAGFGVTRLETLGPGYELLQQRFIRIGSILAASSLALGITVYKLYAASIQLPGFLERPSFSRAMLFAGIALLAWRIIRGGGFRTFGVLACALVTVDLFTFGFGYTGLARRDQIFPPAPLFEFIKTQGSLKSFRIAPGAVGPIYAFNSPMAFGLESVTGYEVSVPPRLRRLTRDIAEDLQPYISLIGEKIVETRDRRLDLLNLKYVIVPKHRQEYQMFRAESERFSEVFSEGSMAVFENRNVLPRAFLVGAQDIQVLSDPAAQVERLKDPAFNPLREVILEQQPEEFLEPESVGASQSTFVGDVQITDTEPDGYRFHVQASTPAILVVSQNYFSGWRANLEGRSLPVFPADHALTGIAVPAGDYNIELVFQPKSFKLGAVLSLISVGALCGLIIHKTRIERE